MIGNRSVREVHLLINAIHRKKTVNSCQEDLVTED